MSVASDPNLDLPAVEAYNGAVGGGETTIVSAAQPSTANAPRRRRPPSYAEQLRRRAMLAPYAAANKQAGREIREARKQ